MNIIIYLARKQIAVYLILFYLAPMAGAATSPLQASMRIPQAQTSSSVQVSSQDPDSSKNSPGTVSSSPATPHPESDTQASAQSSTQYRPAVNTQYNPESSSEPQQHPVLKPVGTAAAPYERTMGVAASRPAGAVIAPARQRRNHIFLIRASIVVGAAVAIGTVAALSHSSSSQPSH